MSTPEQNRIRRHALAAAQGRTVRVYTPTTSPELFSIDRSEWRKLYKQAQRRKAGILSKEDRKLQSIDNAEASRLILKAESEAKAHHDAHVQCFKRDRNGYARWKYAYSPKYAMYHRLKRWMNKHLIEKSPSKKWMHILGYTPEDLAHHLEKQFTKGMSWHNKGAWHIDHIRPVASFDIESFESPEFLSCFGLANLRPLWAEENLRKSDKREFLL